MSSSSMMVTRVFPSEAMTGPRLPLEKSYCLRMILDRFIAASFARRDQSNTIHAQGMNNNEDSPKSIRAQVTKRCPASASGSSIVTANGSKRACSAWAKLILCLARFARAFTGSNWICTFQYACNMHNVKRPLKAG